jgi:hypothetical protein
MSTWQPLLQRPSDFSDGPAADGWFTRIADRLLNGSRIVVGNDPHRFVEVEFYYCGEHHPDPFTHRDPLQLECGRWYFHRTRGTYRNGSFKGLDLTFGDGQAFGGVLIRSIESSDGTLVDGPSLCVDHLLARAGARSVAELDEAVGGRAAWEPDGPLVLRALGTDGPHQIVRSARVGLSLKRAGRSADPPRYIMRPYRYLAEPRRVSKGKPYLVLALYAQGIGPGRFGEITGCPRKSVQRYIEDFEAGRKEGDFAPYLGADLGPKELCRLHGVWHSKMGAPAPEGASAGAGP